MEERKCDECDEKATNQFESKWHCWKHHCDAKQKSNKKYERIEFIKKCVIVIVGIVAALAGSIVIYQFVTNL